MDIPLHLLTGKDSARLIIAWPSTHVFPPAHSLGGKREMRIRHSPRSAPSRQDLRTWIKADHRHYWSAWKQDEFEQFPRIGVKIGPMLANGQFVSPESIANPLSLNREIGQGPYTAKMFREQVEGLENALALLKQRFILGQLGQGPHIDGVLFIQAESLFKAEIEHCKQRRKYAIANKGKRAAKAEPQTVWMKIDESMVQRFRENGYTVRKIETAKPYWELRME
jgi:hypothetical protein